MQEDILFRKYRLIGLLGRGGTAKVYLAQHIHLNTFRAIKCIQKSHPLSNSFLREASILKDLKHPNFPIIYDIEEDENSYYIVEEYLEGITLSQYGQYNDEVSESQLLKYALQLCQCMMYLHQLERPILYLDLKPDNIMIVDEEVKLIDFGSSIFLDQWSREEPYYGSKGFAAPEQLSHQNLDERSDIYGMGKVLQYMMNMVAEVDKKKRKSILKSHSLPYIIGRCLSSNPSQRYDSIQLLKNDLLQCIKQNPVAKQAMRITIAIAGTQERIGVTHLGFHLCHYFIHQHMNTIYVEQNQSQDIRRMVRANPAIDLMILNNPKKKFRILEKSNVRVEETYQRVVKDFGSLKQHNLEAFLSCDVRILLAGGKDWEISHLERSLALLGENHQVKIVMNFLNGRQFKELRVPVIKDNLFRMPYEPNPYERKLSKEQIAFIKDIMGEGIA